MRCHAAVYSGGIVAAAILRRFEEGDGGNPVNQTGQRIVGRQLIADGEQPGGLFFKGIYKRLKILLLMAGLPRAVPKFSRVSRAFSVNSSPSSLRLGDGVVGFDRLGGSHGAAPGERNVAGHPAVS